MAAAHAHAPADRLSLDSLAPPADPKETLPPSATNIFSPASTAPGGRPRALDHDGKVRIIELLKRGLTLTQAAAILATSRNAILNERKRDAHFDANVVRALQLRAVEPLGVIRLAAKTSWRAAAWLVEYRRRVRKDAREASSAFAPRKPRLSQSESRRSLAPTPVSDANDAPPRPAEPTQAPETQRVATNRIKRVFGRRTHKNPAVAQKPAREEGQL
jgi:hypothetical protein